MRIARVAIGLMALLLVAKRVDDMATVRAELLSPRFHVPRIHKLLLTALTSVVVVHLNLHYPCMVHVFRVALDCEIDTETFRAAEVCYTNQHRRVLVLLLVDDLHVGAGVNRTVDARTAVSTVFHFASLG